jgi:hypothetical protein
MNGFYQFTTKIKDTLKLDPFVNTVTYGDIFQVDLSKQTIFPLSHLVVNNVTKESNVMRFNISILAMDIVDMTKDETTDIFIGNDNTQDIWHTQLKVLDRLTELLRRGSIVSEGYQLDGNPTFEQFTERFENYLAGWTVTFDVLVGNDMTICEVGSSGGTCSPAGYLIKDSAGTTLYNGTIASGEVGTITVGDSTVENSDATYSSDIVAEGSLTLPDINVNVKNSLATTVNTGAYPSVTDIDISAPDATINIKKTGDGTIASVDIPSGTTANYSVADNAITVNGTNDFTIDATDPLDIVLSDGTSTVTPTSVTYTQAQHKVDIVLPTSSSIDSDAQSFLTASAITDATIKSAIDTFVTGLKSNGLWNKFYAIYPFVGGSAFAHKWNLKDPRDLDSAFRLTFYGGLTHNANGITGNGTTGYADTYFNPVSVAVNRENFGFTIYSRSASWGGYAMGVTDGASFSLFLRSGTSQYYGVFDDGSAVGTLANGNKTLTTQRSSNTQQTLYRDGASALSLNTVTTKSNPNYSFTLFCRGGAGGVQNFSSINTALHAFHTVLTPTEVATFNTLVVALQTTLSRNV